MGEFIEVNGTRLYYEETGAGEPIVFAHGLLWNTTMFAEAVECLKNSHRCVSYDHRGQGQSADEECDEISVETLAADAAALITHLKLGPVNFVGHSLGGFVALRLAVEHPELVKSLVLCSTAADDESAWKRFKFGLLNTFARWFGPAAVADLVVPIVHGDTVRRDSTRRESLKQWRDQIANNRKTIWRAANGVIRRKSIYDRLGEIKVPALVLVGEEDHTRTLSEGRRIAEGIRGAKLIVIPHGGHMLPVEEPSAVADAIGEFLRQPVRR